MTKRIKKGFTLTELIVVIAIIAILAAVLIPTSISFINKAKRSNDEQVAANMTKQINWYCIENGGVSSKGLTGAEVRTILQGIEDLSLIPSKNKWSYFYNSDKGIIEVKDIDDTELVSAAISYDVDDPSELGDGIYLVGQGKSPIEEAVNTLINLSDLSEYNNIINNSNLSNKFKELVKEFDPETTLYISASGALYQEKKSISSMNGLYIAEGNKIEINTNTVKNNDVDCTNVSITNNTITFEYQEIAYTATVSDDFHKLSLKNGNYIVNTYTRENIVSINKVVFSDGLKYLPNLNIDSSININFKSDLVLPLTIKVIEKGALTNVNFDDNYELSYRTSNIKVEDGAIGDNQTNIKLPSSQKINYNDIILSYKINGIEYFIESEKDDNGKVRGFYIYYYGNAEVIDSYICKEAFTTNSINYNVDDVIDSSIYDLLTIEDQNKFNINRTVSKTINSVEYTNVEPTIKNVETVKIYIVGRKIGEYYRHSVETILNNNKDLLYTRNYETKSKTNSSSSVINLLEDATIKITFDGKLSSFTVNDYKTIGSYNSFEVRFYDSIGNMYARSIIKYIRNK